MPRLVSFQGWRRQILEASNRFVALTDTNGAPGFESDWTAAKICIAVAKEALLASPAAVKLSYRCPDT